MAIEAQANTIVSITAPRNACHTAASITATVHKSIRLTTTIADDPRASPTGPVADGAPLWR
jgi:hypothetical protein